MNKTNKTMNPLNNNNIDGVLDQIIEFLEYINRDDVVAYKKKLTAIEYEDYLMTKFPKFTSSKLFHKIISGISKKDFNILLELLATKEKMKKSPETAKKREIEFIDSLGYKFNLPEVVRKGIRDSMG